MARKRKKRKTVWSYILTFLTWLLIIICAGVFVFSAWKLYGFYRDYKAGTDEYSSLDDKYNLPEFESETDSKGRPVLTDTSLLNDPDTLEENLKGVSVMKVLENGLRRKLPRLKNPIDFEGLGEINKDVIGWLKVDAIDASYPIAQGPDNDFYLHRTFEKLDNFAGCIFLDAETSPDFTDQNCVVYGHNMKNGSMFGRLKEYKDPAVYQQYPYFWIYTENFIYQYRVFSIMETNSSNNLYKIRHYTEEDFADMIASVKKASLVDTGVETGTQDRLVTLSTCMANSTVRFIVVGKLEQMYISA